MLRGNPDHVVSGRCAQFARSCSLFAVVSHSTMRRQSHTQCVLPMQTRHKTDRGWSLPKSAGRVRQSCWPSSALRVRHYIDGEPCTHSSDTHVILRQFAPTIWLSCELGFGVRASWESRPSSVLAASASRAFILFSHFFMPLHGASSSDSASAP